MDSCVLGSHPVPMRNCEPTIVDSERPTHLEAGIIVAGHAGLKLRDISANEKGKRVIEILATLLLSREKIPFGGAYFLLTDSMDSPE